MKKRFRVSTELWMLLPSLILLAGITVLPFIFLVVMSFYKFSYAEAISMRFVGVKNWIKVFQDPVFVTSWAVSAKYYAVTISLETILGFGVALLLFSLKKRSTLANIVICPMFVAPIMVGLLWRFMLHDSYGIYAYFLHKMGFFEESSLLGNIKSAFPCVIIMDVWEWTPLMTIIVLAGLTSLPKDILEASLVDGATRWHQLRYIILPLLVPLILVGMLIRTMDLVRFYTKILITTGGGPADTTKIIAIRIFEQGLRYFNLGVASAAAFSLLLILIIVGMVFVKYAIRT